MRFSHHLFFCLLFPLCLLSCTSGGACRESMEVFAKGEFYHVTFDEKVQQVVTEMIRVPIAVNGVGVDSVVIDGETETIRIPLQKFSDSTSFNLSFLRIVNGDSTYVRDTLTIYHDNADELISAECGCLVNHTLRRVSHSINLLDSVVIADSVVERNSLNNLRLYLREK